jgi:HEPN domain-containing protein
MRTRARGWALLGLAAVAGCDLGTEPERVPIQEAQVAELADAAASVGGDALSLEALLKRMQEAIRASGGNAKAQELLDASTALAKQAREAGTTDKARAETLTQQSQAKLIEAIVLVLGPDVARDAVAAARAVLTDLKAKLAGKSVPERIAAQLTALERRLGEAEAALSGGKTADALRLALSVGTEVRALAGQDVNADAAKTIEEAAAWLQRAKTVAGASPTAEVAAMLAKAQQLLTQAQEALKAGDRAAALGAATESAAVSRRIYDSFTPVPDAARAIEEAAALLAKAKAAAGANPSPEAARLLAKAEQLLKQAQGALEAGDKATAYKLAIESSSISRRVTEPVREPDAAKVIEEAAAWLARAKVAVGTTPTAEMAALLAKAEQLLKQAQDALKAGDRTTAIKLATESLAISQKLAGVRDLPADPAKMIEDAAALLAKTKAAVGPTPSAEVAQILAKAELLLKQAQDALKAGDRATALSLAQQSAELSRKLMPRTTD